MRFVWAVLAFVLAAVLVGAGIAQRTIFLGPKNVTAEMSVDEPQRYTMIDGDVLRAQPGEQTLIARGDGPLFVAQARTADLEAWLSDVPYNHVSLSKSGKPSNALVKPEAGAATRPAADEGTEALVDSDLWLHTASDEDTLRERMQIPDGVSLLVASDGKSVAPKDLALSWPLDTATPWAGPLIVLGGLFALGGIVLYVLAIRHSRRGRGPRRKGPPPSPTEPIDVPRRRGRRAKAIGSGTAPAQAADRRTRRRGLLVIPAIGLSAALLSGCTPDAWPQPAGTPSPTSSPTAAPEANQQAPAMTEAQAARILERVSETLADADKNLDSALAGTRLSGTALTERTTAYTVRKSVADYALPATIPTGDIRILVPQAYDAWPRTTLMLVQHGSDKKVAPLILTMTQQDPWSNYKIGNVSEMLPAAELPDMAPAWLGAKLAPPDSPFLEVAPENLARDFADVIDNGEKSPAYAKFDTAALTFAKSVQDVRAKLVQALSDSGAATTSALTFDAVPGSDAPVALSSIESGAVVAVTIKDVQNVAPTQPGVDIRLTNNAPAKAITGVESSAKGFVTTYGMQLFFAVPGHDSKDPITLLAASQQLVSVEVIP